MHYSYVNTLGTEAFNPDGLKQGQTVQRSKGHINRQADKTVKKTNTYTE